MIFRASFIFRTSSEFSLLFILQLACLHCNDLELKCLCDFRGLSRLFLSLPCFTALYNDKARRDHSFTTAAVNLQVQSIVEASHTRRSQGIFSIEELPNDEDGVEGTTEKDGLIDNAINNHDWKNENAPAYNSNEQQQP